MTQTAHDSLTRRSMLLVSTASLAALAANLPLPAAAQPTNLGASGMPATQGPLVKSAVEAYVYLYPLVVFGVSYEVLTNVETPTWQRLSAPLNQFMSVRQSDPANHG